MEPDEPRETEFAELETLRITTPKAGHPSRGPFRGVVTLVARVSRACADEFEGKLERVAADVRFGRPRVYRNEREIVPPRGDEDDVSVESVPVSSDSDDRRDVEVHQRHVGMLREQAQILQRRIDDLTGEAERARARRDKEVGTLEAMVEHTTAHAIRVATLADQHVEASMRRTFELDTLQQQQRALSLEQYAAGATAVRQAREVLDGFMLRDSWSELFTGIREVVGTVFDSDMGKIAGMQLNSIVAAKVAAWMDLPDMKPADVLAATLVTGAQFRNAAEAVTRWAALHNTSPAGQTAAVVVSILRGDVGVEALEDLKIGWAAT